MSKTNLSPLIGRIIHNDENTIICQRKFTLEKDLYFDHHRFGGVPFLPGVIGLETFAEIIRYKFPNKIIKEFIDVEFCASLRLKNDQPRIGRVTINFEKNRAEAVLCLLEDDFEELVCDSKLCFKATIVFGKQRSQIHKVPILNKMPLLSREFIYQILPHGELLHVLNEINQIKENVTALGYFKKRNLFKWKHKELLIDPLAIEAGFQAIGLFDFIENERVGLPSKIKKLEFFSSNNKPHYIIGEKNKDETFEFKILSKNGDVLIEVLGFETVEIDMGETKSILEKIKSHSIRQLVKIPKMSWVEVVSKGLIKDKLSREPEYTDEFLTKTEMSQIEKLPEKQRKDKIIELYALKRATRTITFSKNMLQYELQFDSENEPFIKKKKKQIFLTSANTKDYVIVIASYKGKYQIKLQFDDSNNITAIELKK